jgi:hypothetical protein
MIDDGYSHSLTQALLVNRHLNCDMGKTVVDSRIRWGFNGRVVLAVLMIVSDWTENAGELSDDLERKELEWTMSTG